MRAHILLKANSDLRSFACFSPNIMQQCINRVHYHILIAFILTGGFVNAVLLYAMIKNDEWEG